MRCAVWVWRACALIWVVLQNSVALFFSGFKHKFAIIIFHNAIISTPRMGTVMENASVVEI